MNFSELVEFSQMMAEALATLVEPVMWFFSLNLGEWLDFLASVLPAPIDSVAGAILNLFDLIVIGNVKITDISILVFLFGSGIIFYFVFTWVKWVLDLIT